MKSKIKATENFTKLYFTFIRLLLIKEWITLTPLWFLEIAHTLHTLFDIYSNLPYQDTQCNIFQTIKGYLCNDFQAVKGVSVGVKIGEVLGEIWWNLKECQCNLLLIIYHLKYQLKSE